MRFVVERDVITDAFKKAARLKLPAASLVANVDKVLVTASEDGVVLRVTNMIQIAAISVGSANVSEGGEAVLPQASHMAAFLSTLPDGDVTFDVSESTMVVQSGSTQMVRQLVSTKNYPSLPQLDVVQTWKQIPTGLFADDLAAVLPVAARASSAVFALVAVKAGVFYGSDGVCAHVRKASGYSCPDMVLSVSAVPLLKGLLLSSESEFIEVGFAKNATLFRAAGVVLLAYNPTVDLPDINAALVEASLSNDQVLEVDRDELARAVRQVRGTTDNFSAVYLRAGNGTVAISSKSSVGQTQTSIDGAFEHPEQEFVLSATALVDALSCYPQQTCRVFLGEMVNKAGAKEVSPVRMSANAGEGGSFVAVMSQLRKDLLQ